MVSFLLMSAAYVTLLFYSFLWIMGVIFSKSMFWHTILHNFGGLFLFPTLVLTKLAIYKRNK